MGNIKKRATMKICSTCGIEKTFNHFPSVGSKCKDCKRLYMKEYVKRKPEIEKARSLRSNEKRKETSKRKTQLKRLIKILSNFAELKENPFKFKKITEIPISVLTPEQKKERNKIQQMEWRTKNREKINTEKRRKHALKTGKITPEQIKFNDDLKKILINMGF
ncbi:MAG: hypothetical protein ACRDBY_13895 [Cetobacterium sp.]